MDKQQIIEQISLELYTLESENAHWFGSEANNPNRLWYSSDLAHTIDDLIWDESNGLTNLQKVQLLFSIYEDLPCYTLLSHNWSRYQQFDGATQERYWFEVRRMLLQGKLAWSGPLEYHLAIDWFELCDNCQAIWNRLTHNPNSALLASMLNSSATAAWYLKAPIYAQLIADPHWHAAIYQSLDASYYALYGQIDKHEALVLLQRLVVDESRQTELATLIRKLQTGDRYTNSAGVKGLQAT